MAGLPDAALLRAAGGGTLRLRLNGFGPPFPGRFATVSDRLSGSWCRFLESWGQDGEDGEKTGKKRRKMGEKWPKESGSNDGLTANAEYMHVSSGMIVEF